VALADFQTLVDSLVRDQTGTLTASDRDRAIELARLRYSADVRRELVQDVVWDVAGFLGPLPEGWVVGATLLEAEHPVGQSPRSTIELSVYVDPAGQLLMAADSLAVGQVVRVRFAVPHVLSSSQDTIPAQHREAVGSYAAHVLCQQMAAYYSAERETSISADGSNTESRARNYAFRAKDYRTAYFAGIGKADPHAQVASGGGGSSSGNTPAAAVGAFAGRRRVGLHTNDTGGF
jgi:hypothetical protein